MPDRFSPERIADYARAYGQMADPPAAAPPDEPMWPYAVLAGGQGADAATTLMGLAQGARETNPLGARTVLIAKAAATPLVAWLMHQQAKKGNTKAQKLIGTLFGLAGAVPAVWNAKELAK